MIDPSRTRPVAPARRRGQHAATALAIALCALGSCGRGPNADDAPVPDDIEFPVEERRLLTTDTPPAAPSGPVSRENYRHQLEALEAEILAEEAASSRPDPVPAAGKDATRRQSSSP